MNQLIFCKFLDAEGNPRGRNYTYNTEISVKEGDYVQVEVTRNGEAPVIKPVIVTQIGVLPENIKGYEDFKDKIKTIIGLVPKCTVVTENDGE